MKKYKIKTICDINSSSLCEADELSDILYLDTGSITANEIKGVQTISRVQAPSRAQRKVKDKTIVYSTVRPNLRHYGILSNPPKNLIVSTGFATLDVKEAFRKEISPLFLYYMITQDEVVDHLHRIAENSVSSYPSINPSDLGNLSLIFPGYDYQCRAARILESLDQKIQINKRIIDESIGMMQDLFDYYFIQFDFPGVSGLSYKSSGGSMQWNDQLKRNIPDGWRVKRLSEIASIIFISVSPMDRPDEIFEHYSIPAFDEIKYPTKELGKSIGSSKYQIPERAILVSKLNPQFKRIWAPGRITDKSVCSTEFMPFVSKRESDYGFLYGILNSEQFYTYMVQCSSSSTGSRKRMHPELCGDFYLAMPQDYNIVDDFNNIGQSVLKKQNQLLDEIQELIAQRNTLLPLLSTAQLSISE